MKSNFSLLLFLGLSLHTFAQELTIKTLKSILDLVDYERPSVSMDTKRIHVAHTETYKTLDDLNQDEMRLGGLRINPTTNISSTPI
jgi:hypothetical protein